MSHVMQSIAAITVLASLAPRHLLFACLSAARMPHPPASTRYKGPWAICQIRTTLVSVKRKGPHDVAEAASAVPRRHIVLESEIKP